MKWPYRQCKHCGIKFKVRGWSWEFCSYKCEDLYNAKIVRLVRKLF